MDNYCKDCKHVRTAEELGVVSERTKAGELFCGKHPPQLVDVEPVCLLPFNDGRGYRNMACFEPDDAVFSMLLVEEEAEALAALFEWRADLIRRAAAAGAPKGASVIDLGSLGEKVNGALGYMRERGRWRVR